MKMTVDNDKRLSSLADMIGDTVRLGVAVVAINAMAEASCERCTRRLSESRMRSSNYGS